MATQPVASPSIPSVRFTAFDVPVITNTVINMNVNALSCSPAL